MPNTSSEHEDHALSAIEQAINASTLPGVVGSVVVMPDVHQGYGFPIGGVAAVDAEEGAVSPGGVGYDINCGVRLVRSNLFYRDVKPHLKQLVDQLFRDIPTGVGKSGISRYVWGVLRDNGLRAVDAVHEVGDALRELLHVETQRGLGMLKLQTPGPLGHLLAENRRYRLDAFLDSLVAQLRFKGSALRLETSRLLLESLRIGR